MPQRTDPFQRMIALLNATLAGQASVVESAMLRDQVTQEEREVDVLITTKVANYKIAMGIEVVSAGRPAGTPWVERMRAKHDNLAIDKLILVSKSGFTKPAIEKARFYGIETLTVQQAAETEWPLLAKLESNGVFEVTTLKYDCAVVCLFDDGTKERIEAPLHATFPVGNTTESLDDFVRRLVCQQKFRDALYPHIEGVGEHEFWLSYTEPRGLWRIEHNGRSGQVEELRIGLKVLRRDSPVKMASGRYTNAPFVAGASTPGAPALQFVLVKNSDGSVSGRLVDREGIRTLSLTVP